MSEAPERIWIEDEFGDGDEDQWTYGTWDVRNYRGYDVEYIRADTVQSQIDAAREATLREAADACIWDDGDASRVAILALIRKGEKP